MGSKEDILVRLKKHAVDQVERPEMTFEPLTFFDPLVQFEKIMKAVGGNCVVLEKGQDVNEVIRNVFPDAKYKFFLTASAEELAKRRLLELEAKYEAEVAAKGAASMEKPEFEQVLADMKQRDYNDSHRALNPLTKAEDAVEIDSTHMNIGQVIDFILDRVAE